jgi:hypothetical protein
MFVFSHRMLKEHNGYQSDWGDMLMLGQTMILPVILLSDLALVAGRLYWTNISDPPLLHPSGYFLNVASALYSKGQANKLGDDCLRKNPVIFSGL